jgi:hypothetical protein
MNTDVQSVLLGYITKFGGFVEKAVDAAMIEIPLVIQEYISWSFWEALVTSIIYLIAVIIVNVVLYKCLTFLFKKRKVERTNRKGEVETEEASFFEDINDDGLKVFYDGLKVFPVFGVLMAILFTVMFSFSTLEESFTYGKKALKIQIAPRVFLIEEAKAIYTSIKETK